MISLNQKNVGSDQYPIFKVANIDQ